MTITLQHLDNSGLNLVVVAYSADGMAVWDEGSESFEDYAGSDPFVWAIELVENEDRAGWYTCSVEINADFQYGVFEVQGSAPNSSDADFRRAANVVYLNSDGEPINDGELNTQIQTVYALIAQNGKTKADRQREARIANQLKRRRKR